MNGKLLLSCILTLSAAAVASPSAVRAEDEAPEQTDLDRLNLAKLMLQDGHFDRAVIVLSQVDPTNEEIDEMEYWRLYGIAYYRLQRFLEAEQAYGKAIELGDTAVSSFFQRALALIKLERSKEALQVMKQAPAEANGMPARYVIESNAHYSLGDKHSAFDALDRGYQRLPENELIARKRVLLLVDLGLYQAAVDEAQVFFSRDAAKPEDFLALSKALAEANQKDRAILLLEQAALLFPEDLDVRSRLALAYYDNDKPLAAGDVLYPVALIDPEKAQSAAELYVKAKRFTRAVQMNRRIESQQDKIRQRLIILLEQSHFEAAAALDERLGRLGLLEDENIAYALAYAHYRAGNFARMERLLSLIRDPSLFRKANSLRRSAEECRLSVWKCD